MNIWAVFSIDNAYDQPAHNLVIWWRDKPSLETVASALGLVFPGATDEDTLRVVNCWQGKPIDIYGTQYRLVSVAEAKRLEDQKNV